MGQLVADRLVGKMLGRDGEVEEFRDQEESVILIDTPLHEPTKTGIGHEKKMQAWARSNPKNRDPRRVAWSKRLMDGDRVGGTRMEVPHHLLKRTMK